MIRQFPAATAAALAASLLLACRDAPTAVVTPVDSALALSLMSDTAIELPGPAEIHWAYTELRFYDGRNGGTPAVEIRTGMEYSGNRASMATSYAITGDVSISDRILNQQDWFYQLFNLRKRWDELYTVPVDKNCGLHIEAQTQHAAWWFLWVRGFPNYESGKDIEFTLADPLQLDPCPPEEPNDGDGGDGGYTGGGWITIETCYYWAHYVNGVLVNIELRYCEYDQVPVADE